MIRPELIILTGALSLCFGCAPRRAVVQFADSANTPVVNMGAEARSGPLTTCAVTQPPIPPFVPPPPYQSEIGPEDFLLGSKDLWTSLRADGIWHGLKTGSGYRMKMGWNSSDFDWRKEGDSPLTVTGKRLDGSAPEILAHGHNAFTWMSVAFDVPTSGCWEITGHHRDRKITFIVWVAN